MAQLPECDKIYFGRYDALAFILTTEIYTYDPALPVSATNPSLNSLSLPPGCFDIAVSRVLGTTMNDRTFYTLDQNTMNLWYYDPVSLTWVNTGHQIGANVTGFGGLGAGGGYLYAIRPETGQVYRYDGTGTGTYLMTISNWDKFAAPVEVVVDCEGNFYVMKATTRTANPVTFMRKYSPAGVLLQSWQVINGNGNSNGTGTYGWGGFHFTGSTVYTDYYQIFGFAPSLVGLVSVPVTGTTVNFANATQTGPVPSFPSNSLAADWASCEITSSLMSEITISASETELCGSEEVAFWVSNQQNQGNNPSYQWFVNGVAVPGATDSFYNYTPQNGDVVTCQLISNNFCVNSLITTSNPITITVDTAIQPALSYNPSAFCADVNSTVLPTINTSGGTFSSTAGLSINPVTGAITPSQSSPGEYVVTYTNPPSTTCPLYSTSAVITVYAPGKATITADNFEQPICLNDTIVLRTSEADGSIYSWEPTERIIGAKDEPKVVVNRKASGFVRLAVNAKGGCNATDSIWVEEGKSCCLVFVPNAFTPNGDAFNDKVEVMAKETQTIRMRIYNRFGQMVFGTYSVNEAWDGTANGRPCDAGVYYYQLSYTCDNGVFIQEKGDITLLR